MEDGVSPPPSQGGDGHQRYYPTAMEQTILVQNVARYFSFPERSVDRNKVAAEVSSRLTKISDHWTHRAVRLWFNNNRHTYHPDPKPSPPPIPMKPVKEVKFKDPPQMPMMQHQMHMMQVQMMQPMHQMQQSPQMYQLPPQTLPPIPNMMLPPPMMPPPPQPPAQQPYAPPQWMQQKPEQQITTKSNWQELNEIARKIMSQDQTIDVPALSRNFDSICAEIRQTGQLNALPIVSNEKNSIVFPSQPDPVTFSLGNSEDMSYSTRTLLNSNTSDHIFQHRARVDIPVAAYDTCYINKNVAAYIHNVRVSPERAVSFVPLTQKPENGKMNWKTTMTKVNSRIESFLIDSKQQNAWLFGNAKLHKVPIDKEGKTSSIVIASTGSYSTPLIEILDHVAFGFDMSSLIYISDQNMKITTIQPPSIPPENNYSILCAFGSNFVCSINQSNAIRMLDCNGNEIRQFVGHTDPAIHIDAMSDTMFVSASDDRSIKLWDIRQSISIGHIDGNKKSITALSCTTKFVFFGVHDKYINVVDIRGTTFAPYLAISTDEHTIYSMNYEPTNDRVHMFGIATKDGNNDSLLFIDEEGGSRKYLYRQYEHFLNT